MLLGIDLARRDVATILANPQGGAELALRADLPKEGGTPAQWLAAMSAARETLQRAQLVPDQIRCVALVLDAPLDANGVAGKSPRVVGWEHFDVPDALRKHLHIPVAAAENRIIAEALGEARFGALRNETGDWLYAHIGNSISAVAQVNGQLLRGANRAAGELGALCVERGGTLSSSGRRGGLEAYCTHENFLAHAASYGLTNQSLLQIWDAYTTNFTARSVCDDFTLRLAQGLGGALTMLNPARLVLGGGMVTTLGEKLLQPLRARIKEFCLPSHMTQLTIEAGQLGGDAAALGAVALALQTLETLEAGTS
jgi:predicted NBD/HSP70 family sugar kinase